MFSIQNLITVGAYFTCGPTCAAAASVGYKAAGGGSIIDILHSAVAAYNLGQQLQTGQVSSAAVRTEFALGAAVDIEEGLKRRNGNSQTEEGIKKPSLAGGVNEFGGNKFLNGAVSYAFNSLFPQAQAADASTGSNNSPEAVRRKIVENAWKALRDKAPYVG